MSNPGDDNNSTKGKAQSAKKQFALQALGGAASRLIADAVREAFSWLASL